MNDETRELGLAVLDFLRTEYPGGIGYDEEDEAAYRLCHAAEIDFTFHRYAEHQKPAALIEGYRRCICCGYEVRVAYVNRCATCKEACDQPYEPALYQHSMGPRGGRPGGDGTISDGPTDDPTGGWLHAAEMTVHDGAISALADKRVTFYRVGDGDAIAVYIEDDQRRLPTIAEAAIMRDAAFELPDVLAEVKRLRERSAVLDAGKYEELVAKRVLRRGHRATRTRRGAAVPRPPSSGARGGSGTCGSRRVEVVAISDEPSAIEQLRAKIDSDPEARAQVEALKEDMRQQMSDEQPDDELTLRWAAARLKLTDENVLRLSDDLFRRFAELREVLAHVWWLDVQHGLLDELYEWDYDPMGYRAGRTCEACGVRSAKHTVLDDRHIDACHLRAVEAALGIRKPGNRQPTPPTCWETTMSDDMTERAHETDDVVLAFDPQQIDDTGYAWAYRSEATRPELVVAGAVLIGGDRHKPRPVRIVDVIERADGDALVHIDELRTPQQLADQLERNRKSAAVMLIDKVLELDEAGELDGVFQRHVEFARDLDRYRRLTGKIEAARQAADNEEDA